MTLRYQRLIIVLLSLVFFSTAILLILINSKKNLIFFYTPTELLKVENIIDINIRIGGFVKKDSYKINTERNIIYFIITDNNNEVFVEYNGILPDLFREEQGVVVEGKLNKSKKLIASKVFAKHDENYMPSSIKKQLEESKYWNKKYK